MRGFVGNVAVKAQPSRCIEDMQFRRVKRDLQGVSQCWELSGVRPDRKFGSRLAAIHATVNERIRAQQFCDIHDQRERIRGLRPIHDVDMLWTDTENNF